MIKSNTFYVQQLRQLHEMCHSLNGVYNCDVLRKAYLEAFNACTDQLIAQGMSVDEISDLIAAAEDPIEASEDKWAGLGFACHRGPGYNGW